MTRTFSAFISHSSKDAAFAMQLVASLEARGLTAWVAPRNVDPGAPWAAEIDRGIAQSACFILVLSESANLSQAVLNEVTLAFNKGKPVFPVRIEDVVPSEALNFYVASVHWIDALDGLIEGRLERLIGAMRDDGGHARRASPRKKVEDPFTVPLVRSGPILPPPRADEKWVDSFDEQFREELAKLKLGEDSIHLRSPGLITWSWADDKLAFGGNQCVYGLDPSTKSKTLMFSTWAWAGRSICDISIGLKGHDLLVNGTSFHFQPYFHRAVSSFDLWAWQYKETERVYSPELSLVETSNSRWTAARLASSFGSRSKKWIKRQFAHPDTDREVDILEFIELDRQNGDIIVGKSREITGGTVRYGQNTRLSWSHSDNYLGIDSSDRTLPCAVPINAEGRKLDLNEYNPFIPEAEQAMSIRGLAWHPSQDIYATSFNSSDEKPEFGFFVVSAETREVLHKQRVSRQDRTTCLAWSPDGSVLALGGRDHAVVLWDFRRGTQSMLLGHRNQIEGLDFSPDGRRLMTSGGGKVLLWDRDIPQTPLSEFDGTFSHIGYARIKGSAWSPSGRMFAIFSGRGIRVLELA